MTKLRPLPFRKVVGALHRLGFQEIRQSGGHVILLHADRRRIVVPRHAREDIGVPLLRVILKQGRIDVALFLENV